MKKLLLIMIGAGLTFGALAQSTAVRMNTGTHKAATSVLGRTTSGGIYRDSIVLGATTLIDSDLFFYFGTGSNDDSGYTFGMSSDGFNAFAQRYDFNGSDSAIEVLGVIGVFGGNVQPTSIATFNFDCWTKSAPIPITSTFMFNGLPDSLLGSVTVADSALHVGDSVGEYAAFFATPTHYLTDSFFVGYDLSYTWGHTNNDTLTAFVTSSRTESVYDVVSGDTIINNQNVSFSPVDTFWLDNGYNLGIQCELFMFPIVTTHVTEGFNGISRNNLTFYGNYPNPATDNTNIKFSLANSTDVTITISDMAGRTINTITETSLAAGMHIVPVATANMPAGDYIYLVRTASNDGMAGKMSVIK